MSAHAALEPRLPELFDTHPVPMWVYDSATVRFLAVNPAMTARYGYTEDEFLGMSLADIRPAADRAALQEAVAEAQHRTIHRGGRWRHRKKDGTLIDVEITSHELTYAGRPARLVMALDVTEQVRAENALRDEQQRFARI